MMNIKNLTNSPFDLVDKDGKKVRLPARGTVDIEPHPSQASYYKNIGYFQITESAKAEPKQDQKPAKQHGKKDKKKSS